MSSKERQFIHDLANPLAIAQGNIKITLRKLNKDPDSLSSEQIFTRLQKVNESLERMANMLSERRQAIIDSEEQSNDAQAV